VLIQIQASKNCTSKERDEKRGSGLLSPRAQVGAAPVLQIQ
jgi:hypothetical protein